MQQALLISDHDLRGSPLWTPRGTRKVLVARGSLFECGTIHTEIRSTRYVGY